MKGTPGALRQALREIVDPFRSLAGSSQALWALYISYWLEGLVYFGVLTVLGKYLSEAVALPDLHAGWVYSAFTGGITLAMLFLGGVADRLGVRRALLLSMALMVAGRVLMGTSGAAFEHGGGASSAMFMVLAAGLAVVVLGYGMYQPAAYAAVKQLTDAKTASMGYAMIYGLMNLGAFFSGLLSPAVRKSVGPRLAAALGVPSGQDMGIPAVLLVYAVLTVVGFLILWLFMTRDAVARATRTVIDAPVPAEGGPEAPPRARLLTPGFLALAGGTAVSVSVLALLAVTAPRRASEEAFASARRTLQAAMRPLEAERLDPGASAALLDTATALRREGARMAATVEEDGRRDEGLALGLRTALDSAAEILSASAFSLGEVWRADEASLRLREDLRSLGLAFMAAAYASVDPVDREVLDRLRARMRPPGEDPVPLEPALQEEILALAAQPASTRLASLRELARHTANALGTRGPLDRVAAQAIAREVSVLDAVRDDAVRDGEGGAAALLQEELLHAAVLLLRDLPPILVPGEDDTRQVRALVLAWLESETGHSHALEALASGVVVQSSPARVGGWAARYAPPLVAGLVCLLLLGRVLLRRRPDHPFHDGRFVFFIFILIPVQTLFAHNWLTLPYYIDRAFGGSTVGENFEFFSNINPVLIFFLAPVVAALSTRARVYPMMIWGTLVMAVPTFLLALPPNPVILVAYILLMSVGEAMWQPRFLQWVAEIAPEGQTGLYMGIGQFPWFLTKVLTGLYSGYFLARFCPVVGPQDTGTLWLLYALIAMVSPVALWLARGWMTRGTGGRAVA
ncbi:MAG: MFS transporter [Deltaproteobacteria bacterium]|nr:MFS transporter [Deltaproteobacteria bacterium]